MIIMKQHFFNFLLVWLLAFVASANGENDGSGCCLCPNCQDVPASHQETEIDVGGKILTCEILAFELELETTALFEHSSCSALKKTYGNTCCGDIDYIDPELPIVELILPDDYFDTTMGMVTRKARELWDWTVGSWKSQPSTQSFSTQSYDRGSSGSSSGFSSGSNSFGGSTGNWNTGNWNSWTSRNQQPQQQPQQQQNNQQEQQTASTTTVVAPAPASTSTTTGNWWGNRGNFGSGWGGSPPSLGGNQGGNTYSGGTTSWWTSLLGSNSNGQQQNGQNQENNGGQDSNGQKQNDQNQGNNGGQHNQNDEEEDRQPLLPPPTATDNEEFDGECPWEPGSCSLCRHFDLMGAPLVPQKTAQGVLVDHLTMYFQGSCQKLDHFLFCYPEDHQMCDVTQATFDWNCGCNPNWEPETTPIAKMGNWNLNGRPLNP